MLPAPTNLSEFSERVRCLCAIHYGSITSWFRSESRNQAVGGVPASWHRLARGGLAVDVVLDDMAAVNKRPFIQHAQLLGLRALDEGDHLHVQPLTFRRQRGADGDGRRHA